VLFVLVFCTKDCVQTPNVRYLKKYVNYVMIRQNYVLLNVFSYRITIIPIFYVHHLPLLPNLVLLCELSSAGGADGKSKDV